MAKKTPPAPKAAPVPALRPDLAAGLAASNAADARLAEAFAALARTPDGAIVPRFPRRTRRAR